MFFDRDGKYNWVDENNVVVGYSSDSCCCEHFGFYYTMGECVDTININLEANDPPDLTAYRFDPDYFKELNDTEGRLDSGGAVAFRLVAPIEPDIYLVLFNSQNGYYSHGFNMDVGGISKRSGSL